MSQLSGIGRTLGKRKSGLNWFIRSLGEGGVGRGFHSLSHLKLDKEKNKVKNSYLKMWGGEHLETIEVKRMVGQDGRR